MDDAVIDLTVVEELVTDVADGDPALLLELVGMFAAEGPARASRISAAAVAGDHAALERDVHALKGSAGNLGAGRVVRRVESLQAARRAGESSEIVLLAEQLAQDLREAMSALEQIAEVYRGP